MTAQTDEINIPSVEVLGVRVNAVQIPEVIGLMEHWIQIRSRCHTADHSN